MDTNIAYKYCGTCETEKPIEQFSKDRTRQDGYQWSCKTCSSEYGKMWRERQKEKRKMYG